MKYYTNERRNEKKKKKHKILSIRRRCENKRKTSTDVVVVAEDGALFDGSISAEHDSYVVLGDFLRQHSHKEFTL